MGPASAAVAAPATAAAAVAPGSLRRLVSLLFEAVQLPPAGSALRLAKAAAELLTGLALRAAHLHCVVDLSSRRLPDPEQGKLIRQVADKLEEEAQKSDVLAVWHFCGALEGQERGVLVKVHEHRATAAASRRRALLARRA